MNTQYIFNNLLAASIAVALIGVASPALAQGGSPWQNEMAKAPTTQNQTPVINQGNGSGGFSAAQGTGTALPAVDPAGLTQAETDALLFMREEEKLARDVYTTLYEQWGLTQFSSIAASEQAHTDAIKTLLDRYGVLDTTATEPGVFANSELQSLYNDLVARGSKSAVDALAVGALIEEVDIADLDERMGQTDQADILAVYANLRSGSENHLRAFVRGYEAQTGMSYAPQVLDAESYAAILSGTTGQGNGASAGTSTGTGVRGGNGGQSGGRRP